MPQSLAFLNIHAVFSTKHRFPYLKNPGILEKMHSFMGGALLILNSPPIIVGGVSDHVHLLYRASKNHPVSHVIGELKRVSSRWIKAAYGELNDFQWQTGYGVFSVGKTELHIISQYIRTQENHHNKTTFQEEYRKLLDEHEMEYNEQYVWD